MAAQGGGDMNLDDVVNENVNTLSVSELIWSLKSAFQKSYFTEVESVLVSREQKLHSEIEGKVKEYNLLRKEKDLLEEKHGMEMMEKLRLEKELEGCRRACIELKEANSRLTEEHVRLAAIAEDKQRVITELKRNNCDLEWGKSKAEIDVDVYKTKCEELDKDLQTRVARLEKELVLLPNLEPLDPASARVSEGSFGDKAKVDCVKIEVDVDENVHCEAGGPPSCCVPEDEGRNLDSADNGRPLSENIIEIPDSDDDSTSCESMVNAHIGTENETGVLKRKWALWVNKGENDAEENDNVQDADGSCPNNKHKMPKVQELIHVPNSSPVKHCSTAAMTFRTNNVGIDFTPTNPTGMMQSGERMGTDHKSQNINSKVFMDGADSSSFSSSDSEDDLDFSVDFSCMTSSWQRGHLNGSHKRWEFEVDMIDEFRKDEQFCMEAVCALYRQQLCESSTSQNRGFNKLSTTRGTTLAMFLVDGDPKGKLKKSKADLMAYDNKGLDDCRSIAISHAKELFEIYQKKEDDLFLN